MFHAALLAMMNTTFAPWRFALSISIALMPNAPSPLTTTTCRPGCSSAAATPNGVPTPRQPNVPGSRYVRGASSPRRAKLRMSPPSAIVIASGVEHLAQRREDPVGMHVAVLAGRRVARAPPRTSPSGAGARRAGPASSRCRPRPASGQRSRSARRARDRDAQTARLRRADSRAALRRCRRCGSSARSGTPPASRSRSGSRACGRRRRTRSASFIARARTAPTNDGCVPGTRPRLSCVSR